MDGLKLVNGKCGNCKSDEVYVPSQQKCRSKCGDFETYNGKECVCKDGYDLISGKCAQCRSDEVY